jgi:hypothetical protein
MPSYIEESSNPQWVTQIKEIQTDDPVMGGPTGPVNVQAKQLAERSSYLKKTMEASLSSISQSIDGLSGAMILIGQIEEYTADITSAKLTARATAIKGDVKPGYTLQDLGDPTEANRFNYWQYQSDGSWYDMGERGDVSVATPENLGVVKSAAGDWKVAVAASGVMSVNVVEASPSAKGIVQLATTAEILGVAPPEDKPVRAAQFAARGAYFIGEIYPLLVPRPGFMLANGQTLENVDVAYPALLAWLQDEGQYGGAGMNVSLADWNAEWNDDAGKWRGQQGACGKYSLNLVAKTIKMPDWRGLVAEYAGYDGGAAGGTHGDMIRNIQGLIASFRYITGYPSAPAGSPFYSANAAANDGAGAVSGTGPNLEVWMNLSRSSYPVGNAVKPRAVCVHPCAYVGSQ